MHVATFWLKRAFTKRAGCKRGLQLRIQRCNRGTTRVCSDLKHLNGRGKGQIDVKFDGNFYTITNPATRDRVACVVSRWNVLIKWLTNFSIRVRTRFQLRLSRAADAVNCWAAACKSMEVHFYLRMRVKLCDVCIRRNGIVYLRVCRRCFYFSCMVCCTQRNVHSVTRTMRIAWKINWE